MSYTLKIEINVCSGTMYQLENIGNYPEQCEPLFDEAFPALARGYAKRPSPMRGMI